MLSLFSIERRPPIHVESVTLGLAMIALMVAGTSVAVRSLRAFEPPSLIADAGAPLGTPFSTVLVLRGRDCDGNIAWLGALTRPRIARGVTIAGIAVIGSAEDVRRLRGALERTGHAWPVIRRAESLDARLRELGYARHPAILVFGARGELRLAAPVPSTIEETIALRRGIEAFVAANDEE